MLGVLHPMKFNLFLENKKMTPLSTEKYYIYLEHLNISAVIINKISSKNCFDMIYQLVMKTNNENKTFNSFSMNSLIPKLTPL